MPDNTRTRGFQLPIKLSLVRPVIRLLLLATLFCPLAATASDAPLVAAAAGTQFALREIAKPFEDETGTGIRLTLASSGKLFRQIENGAPFELFISADDSLVQKLVAAGLSRGKVQVIARGRLALIAPADSPLSLDAGLDGLRQALANGQISRFAIANPEHAPYGQRAREALQAAGLWQALQERLVVGENVAQATQFALSGAAQGGLVALSLLVPDKTIGPDRYALLPESWHQPLLHSMVLLKPSDETTMKFFQYLKSPAALRILSRYGYSTEP